MFHCPANRIARLNNIIFAGFILAGAGSAHAQSDTESVAPPASDETLIYVIREGSPVGGAVGQWIAINDQVVARIRNNRHAVIRAQAGLITLNMSQQGITYGHIALDDRPGETVYLQWTSKREYVIEEVSEEVGLELIDDTKRIDDIDAPRPNNEYFTVLLNPGEMGFDLMRPAQRSLTPSEETAVITFFQREEKDPHNIGVWGANGFLGHTDSEQAFETIVSPGTHYFLAGKTGSSLVRADVEAGHHYYIRVDVGRNIDSVKLIPIETGDGRSLEKWLEDVEYLALDPATVTARVQDRFDLAMERISDVLEEAPQRDIDRIAHQEHAF